MKVENIFNESEIAMIFEPLANYAAFNTTDYRLPLKFDVKMKLLNSIMDKIEALNPLTMFTKQEYSVLLAALLHYEDVVDEKSLTPEFYKLVEKIDNLIG